MMTPIGERNTKVGQPTKDILNSQRMVLNNFLNHGYLVLCIVTGRKENQARSQQLQKDIRGKFGRGPTKVKGSYIEKDEDTGKETKVKEKSYVIDRGKMGKRKFKKEVKKLGRKYGQDSVLTQTKKTGTLHRTRKGGLDKKGENVGRFQPQGKNPYGQSQIKGKTFAYNK